MLLLLSISHRTDRGLARGQSASHDSARPGLRLKQLWEEEKIKVADDMARDFRINPKKAYDSLWEGDYTYFVKEGLFEQRVKILELGERPHSRRHDGFATVLVFAV